MYNAHTHKWELSPNPLTQNHKHAEERLLNYYSERMKVADPNRPKIFSDPYLGIKANPIAALPGSWEMKNVYSLWSALITVVAHWDGICKSSPCPVNFTNQELCLFQTETENIERLRVIIHQLEDEGGIPLGGIVRPQYNGGVRKAN